MTILKFVKKIIIVLPIAIAGLSFLLLVGLIGFTYRYPEQVITLLEEMVSEPTVQPKQIIGIGIVGDSQADEYRADDSRGLTYAPTTLNWVEELHKYRSLNFGPWGSWGEPRRTGYEYNFARTGATVNSMFVSSQVEGLRDEIKKGKVNVAIIAIGANDFAPYITPDGYDALYNNTVSETAMLRKKNQIVSDIRTAIDVLQSSGDVRIILVLIPDWGNHLGVRLVFPLPESRRRVTDLVEATNADLMKLADERGIVTVNPNTFYRSVFADSQTEMRLGKYTFTTIIPGDDPRSLFLDDGIHAGTVLNGLFANQIIIALNRTMGTSIRPFSHEEIIRMSGL